MTVDFISVVIPYYNKKGTIERAVGSVIAQTHPNWELMSRDDASIEPLLSRPSWLQYNIKIVHKDRNSGPGPTRQEGLRNAQGNYVAFLDADDWWDSEFLESCIEKLRFFPNAAAAWCQTLVYHKDGTKSIRKYSEIPFENIRSTLLQYARPWQTGSLLWNRKFCTAWGNLRTHQDYLFEFSNSSLSDNVIPVPRVLYFVDMRGNDHRIDAVAHKQIVLDHFDLHKYVYETLRMKLNTRERVLLFHRLLRCLWKITEHHTPIVASEYWKTMETYYHIIKLYSRNPLFLKYTHYLMQKTPFKLYL